MNMRTECVVQGFSQNDLDLLHYAFDALRRMTGLEGRLVPTSVIEQDGQQANAVVEIVAEGKRYAYAAVCKRVDRFATLGIIKHQLALCDKPGLLVAPHITPEVAARCRELYIPFIDTAGNVSLCAPGVFVFVTGQRPRLGDMPRTDTTPRVTTATGLRVVFALLCRQELLNAPYRDMVRCIGFLNALFRRHFR